MKNFLLVFGLIFWIENIFCDEFLDKFHQHDYEVKHSRTILVNYDKNYVNFASIRTFKINRTAAAENLTANFKYDMEDKIEVLVQAYKFASNQYRLFPVRYQLNACRLYNANIAGIQRYTGKCGNFTSCIFKGNVTYHVCNFMSDHSRLPPLFPNGMFMLEFQILFVDIPILVMETYFEIYRPISYPKK